MVKKKNKSIVRLIKSIFYIKLWFKLRNIPKTSHAKNKIIHFYIPNICLYIFGSSVWNTN